jgi:hypothetical protein
MRRIFALAVLLTLTLAPTAQAGEIVDRAVADLRNDPVYVDPEAERALDGAASDRLRERIADAGAGPVYVAILPDDARNEAGGDAGQVLNLLHRELGREGTYAVVVGGQFRAASTELGHARAAELARRASEETGNERLASTLVAFVDDVAQETDGGGSGLSTTAVLALVPVLAGIALLATLVRARRRSSVG